MVSEVFEKVKMFFKRFKEPLKVWLLGMIQRFRLEGVSKGS